MVVGDVVDVVVGWVVGIVVTVVVGIVVGVGVGGIVTEMKLYLIFTCVPCSSRLLKVTVYSPGSVYVCTTSGVRPSNHEPSPKFHSREYTSPDDSVVSVNKTCSGA